MTVTTTIGPLTLERSVSADELACATLPVATSSTMRTVLRTAVPAEPGDLLKAAARMQITNDTGAVVGAGWHLWVYDCDLPADIPVSQRPWTMIGPWLADNVPPDRHHMPMQTSATWVVPEDWPPGHRAMVVLRAAAFRTSYQAGETVRVDDGYGLLAVERWIPPTA